jgi:hypothetical protein
MEEILLLSKAKGLQVHTAVSEGMRLPMAKQQRKKT